MKKGWGWGEDMTEHRQVTLGVEEQYFGVKGVNRKHVITANKQHPLSPGKDRHKAATTEVPK